MKKKNPIVENAFSVLELLIGTALTAVAFGMVIIPQGFSAAGVTGISRVLSDIIPVPISFIVFIINMILLIIAWVFVGKKFALKTVAVSVLFPTMLDIFLRFPIEELYDEPMLSAFFSAVLLGAGSGLVLRSGASNGGFDVIAVIINRKYRIPISTIMNIFDAVVILAQAFGHEIVNTLYGILVITISAGFIGKVVSLGTGESQITIFSKYHDEIRDALLKDMDVGVTSLIAESGFTKTDMKVIVSVVPYEKVVPVKKIITSIDPTAFVVVDDIRSVLGRGYTLDKNFREDLN